jgi:hypothetical protein
MSERASEIDQRVGFENPLKKQTRQDSLESFYGMSEVEENLLNQRRAL